MGSVNPSPWRCVRDAVRESVNTSPSSPEDSSTSPGNRSKTVSQVCVIKTLEVLCSQISRTASM
ncbi:MAG: hypothetical protein EBQ48_00555 [Betaproteobacteria bacterium]|nr:hypothetical protein [Betaproteobacteria bacterium]